MTPMIQPIRCPRLVAVLAAAAAAAMVAGCSGAGQPTDTSTSHSVSPTSKVATPGGGNNFSPTPVAPLTPTAGPGQGATNPRP